MNSSIIEITKDVKWIGILDKDIVNFDIVMETHYGTTYNSYYIDAEKKAIIDTSKGKFKDEFLNKVKTLINPSEIEVIVANHTEPDHSENIKYLLELAPNATVYASKIALGYLSEIINKPFKSVAVKDGDSISLGNKTLQFISAPNLHWPDTIFTYLVEDKLLFTCDSFGAHYCDENMFDDLVDKICYSEAFNYYFNVILRPYSAFMLKAIEKIRPLAIEMICPGHGPILRTTWKEAIDNSEQFSREYLSASDCSQTNVLITYVSAYGYTKQLAEDVAKGIREVKNCNIELVDIEHILPGELESKIVKSNALVVGSPTINKNTLLPIYKLFALINPIRDRNKKAAAFGSYGWSGEAVGIIEGILKSLGLNIVVEGARSKFAPANEKEQSIIDFGKEFAKALDE
jgi:NADH oxidase (H2O-forming)